MRKITAFLALVAVSLFGGEISIEKIYAKESMKSAQNGAVFMNIKNDLGADIKLIGASSSVCQTVEIHTHKMIDGMKMMTKIDDIEIKAGESVELKPGGLHIMLMGLNKQLINGESVDLTLNFDTGKSITIKDISVVNQKTLFLEK
ncbi:hypothetical protein CR66_03645 [Campylobacter mucosalis]|uniref:copper chaperone PCu(A)C n=1 Tax=Campylobacter mucosalis TaxID=202 RepID=UPI0004D57E2B|nr:copper chaperone PCu(A)C [Campylobacter mucosalis]KEA46288.1 hypothetical protein CR66_03645 [Campylobacter mucosalis]QKF62758.1 copper chaperone PCu(A)C [Campylobacter mucosalis]